VPGDLSDKYDDIGGLVCLRTAGHDGACIATAGEAGLADGVHWCCREALDDEHAEWCPLRETEGTP
jgi:hypothetical protein